ncbi:MAG: signal peptide peptidase SppA [Alphaproteobacteria bacterium]
MFAALNWLWMILKGTLNAVAKVITFFVLLIAALFVLGLVQGDGLEKRMVLELDLREPMDDKVDAGLFGLGSDRLSIMDVVFGLDAAERDPRVAGVLLRVGSGDLLVPKGEELRDALKRFRKAGKFVIAHSQGFYSGDLGDFLVATAADEVWMQPASSFFPAGTASTTVFFKGMFDKIDAVPQFSQRDEYKSGANTFMEHDFTPQHREATTRVLQSWYDTATADLAADLKMDRANLAGILENSPTVVAEVKKKGLITAIGYDDDAREHALTRAGDGAKTVEFAKFAKIKRQFQKAVVGPKIALVHAAGTIVEGDDDSSDFGGDVMVASDDYAKAIREATKDDNIKAIIVRVSSPGGSATASDQILDALKKAHAAGKPIVVSMGWVAASGGYYISLAGDRIVAEPGTLTSSIGAYSGKVAIGKSLELLGLEAREIGVGRNALFLSGMQPWTPEQLTKLDQQLDMIYLDFKKKVADGRKLPLAKVDQIARGRVWTGVDAKQHGLVDELGGFWTAVSAAKKLANIPEPTRVGFVMYPKPKGWLAKLTRAFGETETSLKALQGIYALMRVTRVQELLAAIQEGQGGRAQFRAASLPGGIH